MFQVPHLDARKIGGKPMLLFGPFAGFSPRLECLGGVSVVGGGGANQLLEGNSVVLGNFFSGVSVKERFLTLERCP